MAFFCFFFVCFCCLVRYVIDWANNTYFKVGDEPAIKRFGFFKRVGGCETCLSNPSVFDELGIKKICALCKDKVHDNTCSLIRFKNTLELRLNGKSITQREVSDISKFMQNNNIGQLFNSKLFSSQCFDFKRCKRGEMCMFIHKQFDREFIQHVKRTQSYIKDLQFLKNRELRMLILFIFVPCFLFFFFIFLLFFFHLLLAFDVCYGVGRGIRLWFEQCVWCYLTVSFFVCSFSLCFFVMV